jgi:hypothetical protein
MKQTLTETPAGLGEQGTTPVAPAIEMRFLPLAASGFVTCRFGRTRAAGARSPAMMGAASMRFPPEIDERRAAMITIRSEALKALEEAFRAALLLTGSMEAAEYAVLGGIAALESGDNAGDILLVETAKAVIQWRADFPTQSESALSRHPRELQRVVRLAPISRDCFMLRVLLGIKAGTCSRILGLGTDEFGEVLCAALQELPRLEAESATRRESNQM